MAGHSYLSARVHQYSGDRYKQSARYSYHGKCHEVIFSRDQRRTLSSNKHTFLNKDFKSSQMITNLYYLCISTTKFSVDEKSKIVINVKLLKNRKLLNSQFYIITMIKGCAYLNGSINRMSNDF